MQKHRADRGKGPEERGAVQAALQDPPDLILLDLMLPDLDGFELLRRLRQRGYDLPVIILTARDDDVDVVVGLELGADDYVVKPFHPRELVARVRSVLRRRAEVVALAARVACLESQLPPSPAPVLEGASGGLQLDPLARRAWFAGQLLDLRPREYDLLCFLAQHQGQVLSRDTLLEQVWGEVSICPGFFYSTHKNIIIQNSISTLSIMYKRCYPVIIKISSTCPLFLNNFNPFITQVRPDFWPYIFKNTDFLICQGST